MNEHDYVELFRLIRHHVYQPNMTDSEKADHLEVQARNMGAIDYVDEFVAQWLGERGEREGGK